MTTLRKAAQQALEVEADRRRKALAAEMRAALAQQAEPTWVCPDSPEHRYAKPGHCEDCGKTLVQEQGCDHCNHPLYAATKCRVCGRVTEQAESVEPVAGRAFLERILTAMEGVIDVADRKTDEFDALRSCVIDLTLMLHTAPPQRKPLTDEEIERICMTYQSPRQAARAVERAHGITGDNNG